MQKNIFIKTRIDDKLKEQINKKLLLKKFSSYDESKFIRKAIDEFIEKNLFNYISNINTMVTICNEIIYNANGLSANISQIIEHFENYTEEYFINTITNLNLMKDININCISDLENLVNILKPYEKNNIKNNIIICRIDLDTKNYINNELNNYAHINLDISKFIRAAIKYFIDSSCYELSETQVKLFRVMIKHNTKISNITNDINKIAFYLNSNIDVDYEDLTNSIYELNTIISDLHDTTIKLI